MDTMLRAIKGNTETRILYCGKVDTVHQVPAAYSVERGQRSVTRGESAISGTQHCLYLLIQYSNDMAVRVMYTLRRHRIKGTVRGSNSTSVGYPSGKCVETMHKWFSLGEHWPLLRRFLPGKRCESLELGHCNGRASTRQIQGGAAAASGRACIAVSSGKM